MWKEVCLSLSVLFRNLYSKMANGLLYGFDFYLLPLIFFGCFTIMLLLITR